VLPMRIKWRGARAAEHHGSQAVILDKVKQLRDISMATSTVVQKVKDIYNQAKRISVRGR